jgi:CspA family cold shock protein
MVFLSPAVANGIRERNLIAPSQGRLVRPRLLQPLAGAPRVRATRSAEVNDVANGTIKRLVRDRGFGFIRDDGGQEWFFHRSSVKAGTFEQLNEGQRVSFDEEPSAKGPRAGNIRSES